MQVHEKKLEIYFSKISAVLNVIPLVFLFLWHVSFLKFLMFFFFSIVLLKASHFFHRSHLRLQEVMMKKVTLLLMT